MEAILKFNLDNPDDKMAYMRCVKATSMACVLWEISNNGYRKLEDKGETIGDHNEGVIETLEFINNLMDEHGIYLNELIQ